MSTPRPKLIFNQYIAASPALVFRAFTNSTMLREWLCEVATVSPRPGGRIYLNWVSGYSTSGEYTQIEPERLVAFTWQGRGEPKPTQVLVTIRPSKKGARLRLVHRGLGRGSAWNTTAVEFEKGWRTGLENLAHVLEHGPDLRVVRRPMLGVGIGGFDAEVAKRLGVPVTQGLHLDTVVEGLGAQAAGLQKDDVIIGLDGDPITDFPSLASVVTRHQAGDQVEVLFYRGAEKKTTQMTFSKRPLPEVPAAPAQLAEEVGRHNAEMMVRLEEFLAGISEAEASFNPAPTEWSIKGVLAHLVQGERAWQQALADMIGGHEPYYDDFGGNLQAWIDATLAAYPTVAELVAEMKRHQLETRLILANLPAECIARKSTYWRVGTQALQAPFHFDIHLEQMQAALEAARKA